jgi:hypothetical protein
LGASAAEKEQQKLDLYFVRTAEYSRALRADGAVVVGRKGSGKTAIFFSVMNRIGGDRRKLTVDLRPASHSLTELREKLLEVMSVGVFDHTIAAFWQYILYMEILLAIRERQLPLAKYHLDKLTQIQELETAFGISDEMVSGDGIMHFPNRTPYLA